MICTILYFSNQIIKQNEDIMKNYYKLVLLFLFGTSTIFSQDSLLTLEQAFLFAQPRLQKALPTIASWVEDENSYLITKGKKIFIVNLVTNAETILLDYAELNKNIPAEFDLAHSEANTENYSKFIVKNEKDIFLFDRSSNKFAQLTNDSEEEKNPTFSPNGDLIAYTKNNNLFVYDLKNKIENQLTNSGSDVIYNGFASWIYYEEILGRGSNYRAFYWSPDSKKIAFMQFDDSKVPTFTLFNAEGVHGELEVSHYPKPGDEIPTVKLGVVNLETSKTVWIDSTTIKKNYIAFPYFTTDCSKLLFQKMNRGQDSLQIVLSQIDNPNSKEIYKETQKTWVEFIEDIHLLENGKGFLFRSEVNGWQHIYHFNFKDNLVTQITNGNWNVSGFSHINENAKTIYFHASIDKSTETQLYKVNFDGSNLEQLTNEAGTHNCTVIPNGKFFIDKFSSINQPAELILNNILTKTKTQIATSKLPEMDNYNFGKVELFTIPTEDGYNLPTKWFLPQNFDESKKYPIIFSIYGGPGNATVFNSFPARGLGNYFLAQNGIIVIEVDNRGSGHFGKKGKDEMHRKLGTWEIDDLVTTVKWLRKKPFINSEKIAITGGSYGGYTTSMALARAGEFFKFGIAKYAVTDWKLYDNIYTERFMDTPVENPEGYKYASVMEHAESYNGGMLITHGSMDDNVHMQNTTQLIDKLQNLDKPFELMIYPNERHGIRFPKYAHSVKLDIDFWFKNLLDK